MCFICFAFVLSFALFFALVFAFVSQFCAAILFRIVFCFLFNFFKATIFLVSTAKLITNKLIVVAVAVIVTEVFTHVAQIVMVINQQ